MTGNSSDKSTWKGIIDSVSDWLKLLALICLVAEATLATAMALTPNTSPLKSWYPVFMLLFLLVLLIGIFYDRQEERKSEQLLRVLELLDPADRIKVAAPLAAAYDIVTDKAPKAEQPGLRQTRQALEANMVSSAPEAQQAREQLTKLAGVYEGLRRGLDPGTKRTVSLTSVVTQARALAKRAGYGSKEVGDLFAGDSEGARIVSLAIVQALPDANFFDLALESISNSRSAFEQYQALQAMEHLLPLLNADQKRELTVVLKDQRSGGHGKFITKDSDRWLLSSRMLDTIQQ
ncbi:MAG: hypothetical protein JXA78_04745 [Anaerolineales bacterium]|nr:hypothetical protein [Anaerolineales bacterium]